METLLGLLGVVAFVLAVVGLSAAVTLAVVKLTPQRKKPPVEPAQ